MMISTTDGNSNNSACPYLSLKVDGRGTYQVAFVVYLLHRRCRRFAHHGVDDLLCIRQMECERLNMKIRMLILENRIYKLPSFDVVEVLDQMTQVAVAGGRQSCGAASTRPRIMHLSHQLLGAQHIAI